MFVPGTEPQPDLELFHHGKVRDSYILDSQHIAMVASDRLSAYDVPFAEPIPNKGRVLTAMSAFWFDKLVDIVPAQESSAPRVLPDSLAHPYFTGRATIARRAEEIVPIECIIRGYLAGQAWDEYEEFGTIHKTPFPAGLKRASKFPEPIFTPSGKAKHGHDPNISFEEAVNIAGRDTMEELRAVSLAVYKFMANYSKTKGLILADTKLEFGVIDGEFVVCDEAGTGDSSRYWHVKDWRPGNYPDDLDKQYFRDEVASTGWDKKPPAPALPLQIIIEGARRYQEAYERLSDSALDNWPGQHIQI